MDYIKILVNVIGGIAMVIFLLSTLIKEKKNLLKVESVAHLLLIISEALNKTFSSIVQEVISIIRNIFIIFGKTNKIIMVLLLSIATILGIVFNILVDNNSWIGYLPIIANLEFGLCAFLNIKDKYLKLSLCLSNILWAIFFIISGNYLSGGFNIASSIFSLISFFTYKKEEVSC